MDRPPRHAGAKRRQTILTVVAFTIEAMTTRMISLLGIVLAGLLTLVGCGTDAPDDESGPVAVSTLETAELQPVPSDAAPKIAEATRDSAVTVTDLRIGQHDGYDRVVYEFGGTGTPGWDVRYVDAAVQDASGNDIAVAGTSILEVRITGSAYPFDSGVTEYAGPDPLTEPTATTVAEVHMATLFEGVTQSFIGVNGDRPAFTVTALTGPTRVVVDIAN